jgi:hypothetical protein
MTFLVPIVMFGWIAVVFYLFMLLPERRAVIASFVVAWLFLPVASYKLPGIPEYTKITATCYGVFMATLLFKLRRCFSFRPSWIDLPMLIFCLCPFASSVTNGLGPYDGVSAVFAQFVAWGLPYWIGRIYLNDLSGLRQLAVGIFAGGLVYIPLCWLEMRISPQLHRMLYGFHARADFSQSIRAGGYRPTVFMEHGLMVGLWMMAASLMGVWLWRTGAIERLWGVPLSWLVPVLLVTTVMLKATGALFLLILGIGLLFSTRWFRTCFLVLFLIVSLVLFASVRASGVWDGQQAVYVSSLASNQERADSLKFRFDNENILSAKARLRPIFGWGGWGRARIYDENGKDISVTDSLWIIVFGNQGTVGLASLMAVLLVPPAVFCRRYPARKWSDPNLAPAASLAVLLILYMFDNMINAMGNPAYLLACGGLVGFLQTKSERRCLKAAQPEKMLALAAGDADVSMEPN